MKMDDKFVLDRYSFELQRKEQLNAALTLPVALLTAIGTAILAMIRSYTFQEQPVTVLFFLLVFGAGVAVIICTVFLFRAYYRQDYAYLPLLRQLEDWEEEDRNWRRWVEDSGGTIPDDDLPFAEHFHGRIIDAADANTRTNDQRSASLYIVRVSVMWAFIFAAIAGIPYALDQVRAQYVEQLNKAAGAAQTGSPATATPRRVPGQ